MPSMPTLHVLTALLALTNAISATPALQKRASVDQTFTGEGTFYGAGAGQGGSCALFDPIPPPGTVDVAALNAPQYDADVGGSCGACAEVTGAKGTIVVRIVDRCPVCAHGDMDLSEEAFPKIDDPNRGRVPVSWKFVPCPDAFVPGNVDYLFQAGSTVDWFAFQVRNHRLAIKTVELGNGGNWIGLKRRPDHTWVADHAGIGTSFSIRVTAIDGSQITDEGVVMSPGQLIEGSSQF